MYLKHENEEEQFKKLNEFYEFKKQKPKVWDFPIPVIELLDISDAH